MRFLPLSMMGVLGAGCAGDASNELQFHGELPVLPGFSKDTGLQPASSPVQLQLAFSIGGSLTADARAVAGGEGASVAVAGTPGSGRFALDAHVELTGMLHVDLAGGLTYDGPIPGLENLDIAFGGETAFDPFLIGGKASVVAMLPEIALPPIPLPGGLPGTLQITVAEGSVIESELGGTCAGIDGSSATFLAKTATGGNLVLESKIVIKVPVVGDKTFDIPSITVAIPKVQAAMDLGTHAFAGGGPAPTGTSLATQGACDPANPGGPDDPIDKTCTAELTSFAPTWHPPNGSHANLCGTNQLDAFDVACLSETATAESCQSFKVGNLSCYQCLVTPATAPGYGPLVAYQTFAMLNVGGCIALRAPAQLACAQSLQAYYACTDAACSGCVDSTTAERDACLDAADATVCSAYLSAASACVESVPAEVTASCTDFRATTALFCGG